MRYIIYLVKNKINDKVYVGLTSKSLEERWVNHCKKAKYKCKNKNGNLFQRAIIKYGKESWELEILETVNSLEDAELIEKKWIKYFNSNNIKFGYNLTNGGKCCIFNKEVKQKISNSIKKLYKNEDYKNNFKKKLKKWHQKNDNPFLGKVHSEESKKKMSKAAIKRCKDPNWKSPFIIKPPSLEVRKKMSEAAKKRERNSSFCTKEELINIAKECYSKKEIADKLNCTNSNICYLIKSWNIQEEVNASLKSKKSYRSLSDEEFKQKLIELYQKLGSYKKIGKELGCSNVTVANYFKKYNIIKK